MVISTGFWHRLSNSPPWACFSLFPLRGVAKPGHSLGSISLCKRSLYWGLVMPIWLRGLTWESGTETYPGGKKSAGGSVSASSADTRRKG